MIILISPAKTLDFKSFSPVQEHTLPLLGHKANYLAQRLRKLSSSKLAALLNISPKLAQLNVERYAEWSFLPEPAQSKQAMFAFDGDVYDGLMASTLNEADIEFAQAHLRILSGMYGVLKPLDLIQPHRLEMGTHFEAGKHRNLYQFWGKTPANLLLSDLKLHPSKVIINLASMEYFKAVDKNLKSTRIITPVFKELKAGQLGIISLYAKKARGMMSRFAIQHKITEPEHLKAFDEEGYFYNDSLSDKNVWVFARG